MFRVRRGHGASKGECSEPGPESGRIDGSPTPASLPGHTHTVTLPMALLGTQAPIPTCEAHNTHAHTHMFSPECTLTHGHLCTCTRSLNTVLQRLVCPQIFVAQTPCLLPVEPRMAALCPAVRPVPQPMLGPHRAPATRSPHSTCLYPPPAQLAAWCLPGPRDLASLEMSPDPQGPGCRGQAKATGPFFPLPGCCSSVTQRQGA